MKFSTILQTRYEEIQEEHAAVKRGDDPRATIPTGLREFDKRAGHKRKILHLYGAATGEGKSIFKLQLMRAAAKAGYSVFVLDFEDPQERTADREFSNATGINNGNMQSADLTDRQIMQIGLAVGEADWADNIEVVAGVKHADEALELLQENVADLNLIDYLSALPHGKKGREQAISDFCWGVTKVCQESNVAAVAFSQLTSEVSDRGKRMFEMSKRNAQYKGGDGKALPCIEGFRPMDEGDLAWCRDAGKTAKELGFLFRPGRYYKRCDPGTSIKDDRMEVFWPKKNFGAEGKVTLGFDGPTARIYDLPTKGDT